MQLNKAVQGKVFWKDHHELLALPLQSSFPNRVFFLHLPFAIICEQTHHAYQNQSEIFHGIPVIPERSPSIALDAATRNSDCQIFSRLPNENLRLHAGILEFAGWT